MHNDFPSHIYMAAAIFSYKTIAMIGCYRSMLLNCAAAKSIVTMYTLQLLKLLSEYMHYS